MTLQYKDKNRYLKVKMLDGTVKTVLVSVFMSKISIVVVPEAHKSIDCSSVGCKMESSANADLDTQLTQLKHYDGE